MNNDFKVGDIVYHYYDGVLLLLKKETINHWEVYRFGDQKKSFGKYKEWMCHCEPEAIRELKNKMRKEWNSKY